MELDPRPAYPEGEVDGACVCGSWPGGACLKCAWWGRWRPIGSAPKDGTPVLGFMPTYYQGKGGISVVLWMRDAWFDNRAFETTPTFWHPLPDPPKAA